MSDNHFFALSCFAPALAAIVATIEVLHIHLVILNKDDLWTVFGSGTLRIRTRIIDIVHSRKCWVESEIGVLMLVEEHLIFAIVGAGYANCLASGSRLGLSKGAFLAMADKAPIFFSTHIENVLAYFTEFHDGRLGGVLIYYITHSHFFI